MCIGRAQTQPNLMCVVRQMALQTPFVLLLLLLLYFFGISELDLDQAYRLSLNPLNITWLLV